MDAGSGAGTGSIGEDTSPAPDHRVSGSGEKPETDAARDDLAVHASLADLEAPENPASPASPGNLAHTAILTTKKFPNAGTTTDMQSGTAKKSDASGEATTGRTVGGMTGGTRGGTTGHMTAETGTGGKTAIDIDLAMFVPETVSSVNGVLEEREDVAASVKLFNTGLLTYSLSLLYF